MPSLCDASRALSLAIVVLHGWPGVDGKIETGSLRFSNADPNWYGIGKFGYNTGAGHVQLFMTLREDPSRRFDIRLPPSATNTRDALFVDFVQYLDEQWPDASAADPCSKERASHAKSLTTARVDREQGSLRRAVRQSVRPHIWYFGISGCGRSFNATYIVDYELHMEQDPALGSGTHLSYELSYMRPATALAVLCVSCFLASFVRQCQRLRQSAGEVHPVIQALAGSVLLQLAAQILHFVHLQVYESRGASESGVEAAADILFMLSQVVSSTLLVVIARGYTLLSSKENELRVLKPTAVLIALLHVALVGHGKWQGDHESKHHENGGAAGWTLVAVRLSLCAWFLANIKELLCRQVNHSELCAFLLSFRFVGCLYFLSYPAIFIVGKCFAEYLQHPVMHVGLVVMQTAALFWLSELFLSKGSKYNRVSTLCSTTLPQPTTSGGRSPPVCSGSPAFGASPLYQSPLSGSPLFQSPLSGSPVSWFLGGSKKIA